MAQRSLNSECTNIESHIFLRRASIPEIILIIRNKQPTETTFRVLSSPNDEVVVDDDDDVFWLSLLFLLRFLSVIFVDFCNAACLRCD